MLAILKQYTKFNKQIFIAIDESSKYPSEAQNIIDSKKVLNLSGKGNELYGTSWQEKEKELEKKKKQLEKLEKAKI